MNEFEQLWKSLDWFDPVLGRFCAQTGFAVWPLPRSHYPRKGIRKHAAIGRQLHLVLDRAGFPDRPVAPCDEMRMSVLASVHANLAEGQFVVTHKIVQGIEYAAMKNCIFEVLVEGEISVRDYDADRLLCEGENVAPRAPLNPAYGEIRAALERFDSMIMEFCSCRKYCLWGYRNDSYPSKFIKYSGGGTKLRWIELQIEIDDKLEPPLFVDANTLFLIKIGVAESSLRVGVWREWVVVSGIQYSDLTKRLPVLLLQADELLMAAS